MTTAPLCDGIALREDGVVIEGPAEVMLRSLLREYFAGLSAVDRQRHIEQIAAQATAVHTRQPAALRKSLFHVREALRDRLPACAEVKEQPRSLRVDGLLRIDERSFYVYGFAFDQESEIAELKLIAPDGSAIDLLATAFRHPHIDADGFYSATFQRRESGFIALVTTPTEQLADGWLVTMENREGAGLEARCPSAVSDRAVIRQAVLAQLRFDREEILIRAHAHPALTRQKRAAAAHEMAQFGEAVKEPGVSVVIPLFARIDLVEHQLAAMAGDAEIQRAEIVYMLDSPELADELRAKLKQLSAEYRLPLRMVVVRENAGFAAAVNLGVSAARGADVVIMHSDVIPAMPGWIGAMERAREERNAVAAGALLIYKDDSIEHAGYRLGVEGLVGQPMKGLHFKLIESTTSQAADAVSAACMCVDRAAFDAVGGMTGGFIDGEFEDVDLCLRLMARGGVIAWAPSARLYHLEGQSTPVKEREFAKPYNAWLARQRWTASESTPQAAGA